MKIYIILILASSMFYLFACATESNIDFKRPNSNKDRILDTDGEEYNKVMSSQPSSDGGRILVIGGRELKEDEPWQIISWKCRDYIDGSKTLVEVGRATFPKDFKNTKVYQDRTNEEKQELDEIIRFTNDVGFVLYDGTDTGDYTSYHRDGLSHRWDWGEKRSSYSIVIKPDGTGLYYNFSTAENGIKHKADEVFKCSR